MWRFLNPLAVALAIGTPAADAVASVSVSPDEGCPSARAIEANLDRLGVVSLLAQLGSTEVRVHESSLQVSFRDQRGEPLGSRMVTTSPDCRARAALAAAVIAAFAGDWVQTRLAEPEAPSAVTRPVDVAAPNAVRAGAWQGELGATAFAVHDGDAGALGLGARADLVRGAWMATAVVEGAWPRERSLGSGQGAYRFLRAGLGPGARWQGSHLFWDGAVLATIERLALDGRNLSEATTAVNWGFVIAGTTRVGWSIGRLRPFGFFGLGYSTTKQNMTVMTPDGRTRAREPLSQLNVEAGLGISLSFLP